MVEIEEVSRELCGGTHVATTSEIGLFHVTTETSSASNVRRIEAVTGPEATRLFQERTQRLNELAARLKVQEHEVVNAVERLNARVKELEKAPKPSAAVDVDELVQGADQNDGVAVVLNVLPSIDSSSLRDISDTVRQRLGDAVVMLGSESDGRVHLVANVAPSVVERGVSAAALVKAAAPIVGGGGGGRDTLAQAGGKDPEKLDEALAAARAEIEKALG
jgi:alanyl-tRNA synthetase